MSETCLYNPFCGLVQKMYKLGGHQLTFSLTYIRDRLQHIGTMPVFPFRENYKKYGIIHPQKLYYLQVCAPPEKCEPRLNALRYCIIGMHMVMSYIDNILELSLWDFFSRDCIGN